MHLWNKGLSRIISSLPGGHWTHCLGLAKPSKPMKARTGCVINCLAEIRWQTKDVRGEMCVGKLPQRAGKNSPKGSRHSPQLWTPVTLYHSYDLRSPMAPFNIICQVQFGNHCARPHDELVPKISRRLHSELAERMCPGSRYGCCWREDVKKTGLKWKGCVRTTLTCNVCEIWI